MTQAGQWHLWGRVCVLMQGFAAGLRTRPRCAHHLHVSLQMPFEHWLAKCPEAARLACPAPSGPHRPPLPSAAEGLTELSLALNRITGSFPRDRALPASLELLNLYSNLLTGSIPADWALPPSLHSLALNVNRLTGSIPKDWKLPSKLKVRGGMSGLPWCCRCACVPRGLVAPLRQQLFAAHSGLPSCVGGRALFWPMPPGSAHSPRPFSTHLTTQAKANTHASLYSPVRPSNCVCLQIFYLHTNSLTGSISPDWQLPDTLVDFELANNNISGPLPPTWKLPRSLQVGQ